MIFQNYLNYICQSSVLWTFSQFWLLILSADETGGGKKKGLQDKETFFSLSHWNALPSVIPSDWLILHTQDRNSLLGLSGLENQTQSFWRCAAVTAESWTAAATLSHLETLSGSSSGSNGGLSVNSVPSSLKSTITPNLGSSLGGKNRLLQSKHRDLVKCGENPVIHPCPFPKLNTGLISVIFVISVIPVISVISDLFLLKPSKWTSHSFPQWNRKQFREPAACWNVPECVSHT